MKWSGKIGFYVDEEVIKNGIGTGIWKPQIIERSYTGNIVRDYRSQENANDKVNEDVNISNNISVILDRYLDSHICDIKYITFKGVKWKVKGFTINHPRIDISIGGVYNERQT